MSGEAGEERSAIVGRLDRTPHRVLGVPAVVGPDTFRRKWPEPHVPYTRPVHPEPEVSRLVLNYAVSPSGDVAVERPEWAGVPELPRGAVQMISVLAPLPGWGVILSYARGWIMTKKGEVKMSPVWEKSVGEGGKVTRKKVGEKLPPAAHNFLVRGYAENEHGLVFLAGQWINGAWDEGHCVVMPNIRLTTIDWQRGTPREADAKREKEIRRAITVPVMTEWLAQAPTMSVKPDPPEWPPRKGMMF